MPNHVKNIIKLTGAQNEIDYIVNLITKTEEVDGVMQKVVDFNSLIPMPESLRVVSGSISDECLKLYVSNVFHNDDIWGTHWKAILNVLQKYDNSRMFCRICMKPTDFYSLSETSDKCLKLLEQYHADRNKKPFDEGPWFRTTADVIAYGEQIYNNIKKYNAKDWYDWCNEHWNTKWNSYRNEQDVMPNCTKLKFETAWNIPFNFYVKLYEVIHRDCKSLSCNIRYANEDYGSGMGEIADIIGDKVKALDYLEEYEDDELEEIYNEIWEE